MKLRPDFCSVTYGAGGSTRDKTIGIVDRIQRDHGLTAMMHLTCVNATKAELTAVIAEARARGIKNLPIVRIAQLYPFSHEEFRSIIVKYKNASEIVWCQEEPRNQGAWHRIQHYLLRHLLPHQKLTYAGRDSSATPAAGYKALHEQQQKELVNLALTPGAASRADGVR